MLAARLKCRRVITFSIVGCRQTYLRSRLCQTARRLDGESGTLSASGRLVNRKDCLSVATTARRRCPKSVTVNKSQAAKHATEHNSFYSSVFLVSIRKFVVINVPNTEEPQWEEERNKWSRCFIER